MMRLRWLLTLWSAVLLVGLPGALSAAESPDLYLYRALIDSDSDNGSGCDVAAHDDNFTGPVPGIEYIVTAHVNRFPTSADVDAVDVAKCLSGTTFATPTTVDNLNWDVGLENGVNGADVVEFRVPRDAIGNPAEITLGFHATRETDENDVLLTKNGNNDGESIVFLLPPSSAVPALSISALVLCALLLAAIALRRFRRRNRTMITATSILLVASIVATAWAVTIMLDGVVTDWATLPPIATDALDDSTADDDAEDIVAAFVTADAINLYFRMDQVNLAPVMCGNGVLESGEDCESVIDCDPIMMDVPGERIDAGRGGAAQIACDCMSCNCFCDD